MHPSPRHPRRVAPSLLRRVTLSAALLLAAAAPAADEVAAGLIHERISPPDRAAEIGYFGTCPESPDGRAIAYVVYDLKPTPATRDGSPGALYVCDADLRRHVRIRTLAKLRWEDGASQIWLDDDTLAYMDYLPQGPVTYVVRKNGDPVAGPFEGCLGHGDAPQGAVLLWVDQRQYPRGSRLGPSGLYLYRDGAVKQVVDLARDLGALKDRLATNEPPAAWTIFHPQLSTAGTFISIRLDPKRGEENLVTCRADGTDVRLFVAQKKPLHQQWYDDTTIFGHERVFKPADGGPRNRAKRWDRDGTYLETLAGVGNHMGISPDRRFLASESMYELEPVIMRLYRTGRTEPVAVLMNEPAGPVWKMRTHVNPTFSRDGRKVYFNKPVAGLPQVHRVDVGGLIRAQK